MRTFRSQESSIALQLGRIVAYRHFDGSGRRQSRFDGLAPKIGTVRAGGRPYTSQALVGSSRCIN
jgi:hypothetical protein